MSCGVGPRYNSDAALLWLWCRPAATALTGPLAWEPLHATGAALEKTKKKISHMNVRIIKVHKLFIYLFIYFAV